jgi:hypothetical protein
MEWIKKFEESVFQDTYISNKIFYSSSLDKINYFVYKNGKNIDYTLVSIENNGNILSKIDIPIAPDFISSGKDSILLFGKNTRELSNSYCIFKNGKYHIVTINNDIIALNASCITYYDKNAFVISYLDIYESKELEEYVLVTFDVLADDASLLLRKKIRINVQSIVNVYDYNNDIYVIYIGIDGLLKITSIINNFIHEFLLTGIEGCKKYFIDSSKEGHNVSIILRDSQKKYYVYIFDFEKNEITNYFSKEGRDKEGRNSDIESIAFYGDNKIAILEEGDILLFDYSGREIGHVDSTIEGMKIECFSSLRCGVFLLGGYILLPNKSFIPALAKVHTEP